MLSELRVHDFRCIEQATLDFSNRFALIVGPNGAGKTSLLESVFCLGRGRSFRPSRREQLVRHGQTEAIVYGALTVSGREVGIGIALRRGGTEIRIGGESGRTVAELVENLAVQVFEPESHRLISGGPDERRQFVDFGVFHVEHNFLADWRSYRRALVQRNAALRMGSSDAPVRAWDNELAAAGERVDRERRAYLERLQPVFDAQTEQLLGDAPVAWTYRPGWDESLPLAEALALHLDADRAAGYTMAGPHRADMVLRFRERAARHQVSRGQQKLYALALVLAQHEVIAAETSAVPVLCLDDPAAELDSSRLASLLNALERLPGQILMSSVNETAIPPGRDMQVFHVEHGRVS